MSKQLYTIIAALILSACSLQQPPEFQGRELKGEGFSGLLLDNGDSALIHARPKVDLGESMTYEDRDVAIARTTLPILAIENKELLNGVKRPGSMKLLSSQAWESIGPFKIGISIRGNSTRRFEKKSLDIQVGKNSDWLASKDIRILGMRSDDDWQLSGHYEDPTFLRDQISHKIFEKLQGSGGLKSRHVELTLNGDYRGIYVLSEQVDRKQLGLEKYDFLDNLYQDVIDWTRKKSVEVEKTFFRKILVELGKGLYKARNAILPEDKRVKEVVYKSVFNGANLSINREDIFWGYAQKYPRIYEAQRLKPFKEILTFINETNDKEFAADLWKYFDEANLVNYFILIATSGGFDNIRANFILVLKKSGHFHFVPWDLNNTFGSFSFRDGKTLSKTDMWSFEGNALFKRLLQNEKFKGILKKRWTELRDSWLTEKELSAMFLNEYQKLKDSGALARDYIRWKKMDRQGDVDSVSRIHEISPWIKARLAFLDQKISSL